MKICKLTVLLILLPFLAFTQQLTGVWIGKLSNDSVTTRKDQSYELALTEYNGKVFGYSYATFIIEDTLYYIVKRVKGKIDNGVCEVEDDEILSHNFGKKLDKRVKVIQTFRLNSTDSTWEIDGKWKTKQPKGYYGLTGGVSVKEEKDFVKSRLLQHLGDLQLDNTLAFYKPEKKVYLNAPAKTPIKKQDPVIAKNDPAKKQQELGKSAISGIEIKEPDPAVFLVKDEPEIKKPDPSAATALANEKNKVVPGSGIEGHNPIPVVKSNFPAPENKQNKVAVIENNKQQIKKPDAGVGNEAQNSIPVAKNNNPPITNSQSKVAVIETNKQQIKKPDVVAVTNAQNKTADSLKSVVVAPQIKKPDTTSAIALTNEKKKNIPDALSNSGLKLDALPERNKNIIQTVSYKADSLVLSLYDNGEIDGDTVSVFLNGEMLIDRQGLKGTAIKKTIYLKPGEDEEVEILLFAENLGKYPPNTGLLIIRDGEDRYEIRFSADYDLSPAIVLRRKKN